MKKYLMAMVSAFILILGETHFVQAADVWVCASNGTDYYMREESLDILGGNGASWDWDIDVVAVQPNGAVSSETYHYFSDVYGRLYIYPFGRTGQRIGILDYSGNKPVKEIGFASYNLIKN